MRSCLGTTIASIVVILLVTLAVFLVFLFFRENWHYISPPKIKPSL